MIIQELTFIAFSNLTIFSDGEKDALKIATCCKGFVVTKNGLQMNIDMKFVYLG